MYDWSSNLCDSEFANKAKAGKIDEIRPCIGCGRCLTGIMFGKPISCTVNPAVEKEEIDEAPVKKKVLVLGYSLRPHFSTNQKKILRIICVFFWLILLILACIEIFKPHTLSNVMA